MCRLAAPAETPRVTPMRPVTDLSARRSARAAALASAAGEPVLHVTQAFLDALNCRGEWAVEDDEPVAPVRALHAV